MFNDFFFVGTVLPSKRGFVGTVDEFGVLAPTQSQFRSSGVTKVRRSGTPEKAAKNTDHTKGDFHATRLSPHGYFVKSTVGPVLILVSPQ